MLYIKNHPPSVKTPLYRILSIKEPKSAIWPEFSGHGNHDGSFKVLYLKDDPANMDLIASILFHRFEEQVFGVLQP